MEAILDTNILLDVALGRKPHVEHSLPVLRWAEDHPFQAALACHCVDTIHYVLSKSSTAKQSRDFARFLLSFLEVVPLDRNDFLLAIDYRVIPDLEDAFVERAAIKREASCIVTRNINHFRSSRIRALSPRAFLRKIQNK